MRQFRSNDSPGRLLGVVPVGLLAALLGAGLLLTPGPAAGQPRPLYRGDLGGYRHLVFANTYRTVDRTGQFDDYLVIGHYDFLPGQTVKLCYFLYDARQDRKPTPTPLQHPRLTPGAQANAGPIHIPTYSDFKEFRGTWTFAAGVLRVRIGDVLHEWVVQDPAENLFLLRGPYTSALDGSTTIEGLSYTNGYGYGYLADRVVLPRNLMAEDLLPSYKGERYALTGSGPRQPAWQQRWALQHDELNVSRFRAFGDILSLTDVDRASRPPMAVFSTLLLNYAPYSKLLVYAEAGHDFNRNGVFDEYGHTTQLFGIHDGGKVAKFVFVEYSYQTNGYPILAVGRYSTDPVTPLPPRLPPEEPRVPPPYPPAPTPWSPPGPRPRDDTWYPPPDPREDFRPVLPWRGGGRPAYPPYAPYPDGPPRR